MRQRIRICIQTNKQFDFAELGIPMEVFRKRRALHRKDDLHFNSYTMKMLRSSNASRWADTLLNTR
jgi:hypothetical protein